MITRPTADPYTDARQFGALPIHPRGTGPSGRHDAETGSSGDHRLFEGCDQIAHAKSCTAQVNERIDHELPGAVVGHLPAAIDLHHRDVTRREQVGGIRVHAQCEDRLVLEHPEFIRGIDSALIGEGLHRTPGVEIPGAAEFTDA